MRPAFRATECQPAGCNRGLRDEAPTMVTTQVHGDEVRVSSTPRDDLQAVQRMLKETEFDFAISFTNYR
ncbi:MAG: DUF520 family protein [Phycicoccus sp.]